MSDATKLAIKISENGGNREKVIAIVDSYGDSVDWSYHSLDSIIGDVWNSDINSGEDSENWIINEICRAFNVDEVTI